ncbi:MAG: glycoside hydrolase family 15 protein [Rubrivivax sp.]
MLPIEDYALVGDCHGSALIGRDGSVGWCTFGRFDAEPTLFGLLDADAGGAFVIEPATSGWRVERTYLTGTNLLETVFICSDGRFSITDFMPVGRKPGSRVHDYVNLQAPHALIRKVSGTEGTVAVRARWRPAARFVPKGGAVDSGAAQRPAIRIAGDMPWRVDTDRDSESESESVSESDTADGSSGGAQIATFELACGESRFVSISPKRGFMADDCARLTAITTAFWREWIDYCRYSGPHGAIVLRSALVLKLLTYAPTGAIVAAPTTSLPEAIGGGRNWDYRYCWVRDGCFTLYALAMLGYSGEALSFGRYLSRITMGNQKHKRELQIMYSIDGEPTQGETRLDHLSGYRGSRPVRVGNGAHDQRQTDVYGEYADWALLHHALGGSDNADSRTAIEAVAALALRHAAEPEHGIWEMRGPPRHHVLGKVMCWVALDRATRICGERPEWAARMQSLREEITTKGVVDGALAQSYGSPARDAALLLIPLLDFPIDRAVLARTVDAIEAELADGDFLQRYRNSEGSSDGLEGDEGAFLACCFWRVDALLALSRRTEAVALFERLIARANDVGLFAEEIDPKSGAFLGNFPQALSHLALVLNAVHLDLVERNGADALQGTLADRAQRSVGATVGWRALWCAFKDSRRVARLRSSRESMMPPGML